MNEFPTDGEVRQYLWQVLGDIAQKSHKAHCEYLEIYKEVSSRLYKKGYTSFFLTNNLEPRLPQYMMEFIFHGILHPIANMKSINWSEFKFTEYGRTALLSSSTSSFDAEGYLDDLKRRVPHVDSIIIQYVAESLACYRRNISFASAVMLGAAAEKVILLLLDAVIESKQDPNEQARLRKLYDNPNLPKIFETIQKTLEPLTANKGGMDYAVHQGCSQHMLSLFEMIRVQRNESVHPTSPTNGMNAVKLTLSLNSFSAAVEVVYRLMAWFKERKGAL